MHHITTTHARISFFPFVMKYYDEWNKLLKQYQEGEITQEQYIAAEDKLKAENPS